MFRIKWKENQQDIMNIAQSRSYMLLKHRYKDGSAVYEVLHRRDQNSNTFVGINCIGTLERCLKYIEETGEHIIII